MIKITEEQFSILLKEKFPKFSPHWEAHIAYWADDAEKMIPMWYPFSDYAIEVIKANDANEIKNILDFAELMLCEGNQSVQDGIATVFLEHLLAKDSDEIKFSTICKYLGKNSIEYCKAWDNFCGVRTEGLWDDEKID